MADKEDVEMAAAAEQQVSGDSDAGVAPGIFGAPRAVDQTVPPPELVVTEKPQTAKKHARSSDDETTEDEDEEDRARSKHARIAKAAAAGVVKSKMATCAGCGRAHGPALATLGVEVGLSCNHKLWIECAEKIAARDSVCKVCRLSSGIASAASRDVPKPTTQQAAPKAHAGRALAGRAAMSSANDTRLETSAVAHAYGNECTICLGTIRGFGQPHVKLVCGHGFHLACICGVIRAATSGQALVCPNCRAAPDHSALSILTHIALVSGYSNASPGLGLGLGLRLGVPREVARAAQLLITRADAAAAAACPTALRAFDFNGLRIDTAAVRVPCEQIVDQIRCVVHIAAGAAHPSPSPSSASGAGTKKEGLTMLAIVDRSGSMAGASIEAVRRTLLRMLEMMGENDRIGIVAFDSVAEALTDGLVARGDAAARRNVEALVADGMTNITAGLDAATSMVDATRVAPESVIAMLLTDGADTVVGTSSLRIGAAVVKLVNAVKRRGVSSHAAVHAYGYGSGHDVRMCMEIASAGKGQYSFISDVEQIDDALAGTVASFSSIAAKTVTVTITPEPPRSCFVALYSPPGQDAARPGEDRIVQTYSELFSGENRHIVFDCRGPAASSAAASAAGRRSVKVVVEYLAGDKSVQKIEQVIGDVDAEGTGLGLETKSVLGALGLGLGAQPQQKLQQPNGKHDAAMVAEQVLRIDVANAIDTARAHADAGRTQEARDVLGAIIGHITSRTWNGSQFAEAILADLRMMLASVDRSAASAMFSSSSASLRSQRSFFPARASDAIFISPAAISASQSRTRSQAMRDDDDDDDGASQL